MSVLGSHWRVVDRVDHFLPSSSSKELMISLSITIFAESLVVLGYCFWRKKPVRSILATSICANLVTQLFLWGLLNLFFQQYVIILLIAEILIWMIEGVALYAVPSNRLWWRGGLLLSLYMNLVSFVLGWFLSI